ncbi:MAG: helix-turn-helix domain-containing protein [Acidimicrobiia bacterium]|nr:helix-turn-helix domain-containing protein [Acidimicrobiia bacterium]MBV8314138.1 helix-turn-helix domain-containing protein [Planctomycetaceae bacterium]
MTCWSTLPPAGPIRARSPRRRISLAEFSSRCRERPQCEHSCHHDSRGEECPDEDIVAALDASPRTVARVRKRLVTEGLQAALDHRPQPARPDKIKIRGDIEQTCGSPPPTTTGSS